MYLFKKETPYDRETGRALHGDIPTISGDAYDILFVSLGAPKEKIEELRELVFDFLKTDAATKEPRP